MNRTFQGTLFDGETLAAQPVTVAIAAGRLQGAGPEPALDVSLADVQVSDRLANVPRYLYLPEGRTIETADNTAVDALLSGQRRGRLVALVHALEIHSRVAAVATILLVASVGAVLWWGLPVLALRTAQAVPDRLEAQVGQAGLAAINRFLQPSHLSANDRNRVQTQLDRLMIVQDIKQKPQLVLRSMGDNAPNAFALPGGIIVFSDELVRLADDDEIAAVLAHEIGHWQRRHGIQGVLRNSAALLVVSTVTGDLSTLTTFAGTIPFTLLQRGYSREFEAEADRYGVDLLRKARINPEYFASILEKLEKARPATGPDFSYFGTHPTTDDRIQSISPGYVRGHLKPSAITPPAPAGDFANFKAGDQAKSGPVDEFFHAPPVELGPKDKPPRAMSRRAPRYPFDMRKNSIGGTVTVEFIIDTKGNVALPRVVQSTRSEFEAPALAAIAGWKFTAGEKNGRKVNVRASQKMEFNPTDAETPGESDAPHAPKPPSDPSAP